MDFLDEDSDDDSDLDTSSLQDVVDKIASLSMSSIERPAGPQTRAMARKGAPQVAQAGPAIAVNTFATSQKGLRPRHRIPDFGIIIYSPERDLFEVFMLGVEVKPALLQNRAAEASKIKAKSTSLMRQTFQQAKMVFLRYPAQDYVDILILLGTQFRFVHYSREKTLAVEENHDEASYKPGKESRSKTPNYSRVPDSKTRFNNILAPNGKDYHTTLKSRWMEAKDRAIASRANRTPSGSPVPTESDFEQVDN